MLKETDGAFRVDIADPERALAVAYAAAATRIGLATLFALDERLGSVVGTTGESGIGLIRLAWWREALQRLDATKPPPEPLLQAAAQRLLPILAGKDLAEIEDGWSALLDGSDADVLVRRHGTARGTTLFVLAGRVLGRDDPRLALAGEGWALADLLHRHSDAAVRAAARTRGRAALAEVQGRWPRALRPLGALAALARRDLAVETTRQQGGPARLARMLAMRATGF